MKGFEKMDAKTWQTLAEFIVSKYRKMLFSKDLESMDEKIRISRLLEISDLKYKEIFAAIDKDGNGGISRSGHRLNFIQPAFLKNSLICPCLVRCNRNCSYTETPLKPTNANLNFMKNTFFALILD